MPMNREHAEREAKGAGEVWIEVLVGENSFDRNFRAGILQYAREHGFQRVQVPPWEDFSEAFLAGQFDLDRLVVIGHLRDPKILQELARARVPCVLAGIADGELGAKLMKGRCITCATDHALIGRMAAQYFRGQGRFASYGFVAGASRSDIRWWIEPRRRAYEETLAEHGVSSVPCFIESSATQSPESLANSFRQWAEALPKPLAVFAANDGVAREVVVQCDIAGLRLPDEVAVLGVDNDESFCETTAVTISSIELETARLGRRAMALVERMLHGESVESRTVLCPPSHVVERLSTNAMPVRDTFVGRAVDFISANAAHGLDVADVVRSCGTSRRFLEKRFKALTGRTLLDAIHEKRIAHVTDLLRNTDWPLNMISDRAGFSSPTALCALFHRMKGCTMHEYRAGIRGGEPFASPRRTIR